MGYCMICFRNINQHRGSKNGINDHWDWSAMGVNNGMNRAPFFGGYTKNPYYWIDDHPPKGATSYHFYWWVTRESHHKFSNTYIYIYMSYELTVASIINQELMIPHWFTNQKYGGFSQLMNTKRKLVSSYWQSNMAMAHVCTCNMCSLETMLIDVSQSEDVDLVIMINM